MKRSKYLHLALFSVVALFSEILLVVLENIFKLNKLNFYILLHWAIISLVWITYITLVYFYINKNGLNVFKSKTKVGIIRLLVVLILVAISIIATNIAWRGFKPLLEYQALARLYPNPAACFIMQYIYYILEGILISYIVIFSQEFFNKLFKTKYIPWGSIICMLTWGAGHIFSKNLSTGIYAIILAFLFGITHLILNKNSRYSIIFITLMFIL